MISTTYITLVATQMDNSPDPYWTLRPDGCWEDTRCQFGRGDRVQVVCGPYEGCTGTVESIVAQLMVNDQWITEHGYHVILDKGGVATVRWDTVEGLGDVRISA